MAAQKHFLPTTQKEVDALGWDYLDVIIISGDAYIDHPSFGAAVIGRWLEKHGLRVAIVPQPNWQDDGRDFKKLGKPRLFFGVTAGNMDSMVNHYTSTKRLRHDDAYTPENKHGFRPDYATIVYCRWLKHFFPETPIVIGGIEASLRRLSHYDYWSDSLKPSILMDSLADVLVYGMGEKPILDLANAFASQNWQKNIENCKQIAYIRNTISNIPKNETLVLHSFEKEQRNKKYYGEDFVAFETESNKKNQRTIIQQYEKRYLIVRPPYPPATEEEMDSFALYDVMMNAPHPKYAKRGDIPAWEMIKNSITIHRGCFGGCGFCAITAHQGRFISSRSEKSILAEVKDLSQRDYFKGHISDLGAPSANMYRMQGKNSKACAKCARPSCIFPDVCKNLIINHKPLINLYQKASKVPNVKHITIGSGIRYDLLITDNPQIDKENGLTDYLTEVIQHHVSGRLKVAPEHTETKVLNKMRKPPFKTFLQFNHRFQKINRTAGLRQQIVPYFISAHPTCTLEDMKALQRATQNQHLHIEQVQDFTPTPMTYATAMFYLGYDPYTGEKVYTAKDIDEKNRQKQLFFAKNPNR